MNSTERQAILGAGVIDWSSIAYLREMINLPNHEELIPSTDSTTEDLSGDLTMAEIIEQWQTRQPGLIITGNEIEDKIREFEAQYGLSSDELLRLVERGEAPEGTDIMEWRILLDLR